MLQLCTQGYLEDYGGRTSDVSALWIKDPGPQEKGGIKCACVYRCIDGRVVIIISEGGDMQRCVSKIKLKKKSLLCLKRITNKDLLYSAGDSAQCYVAAWMGGESGGERIHVYVWLSRFAVPLKLSQHC